MSLPQRTFIIVAGILVLVVAAGCGSTNSADGVRRIELVSNDRHAGAAITTTAAPTTTTVVPDDADEADELDQRSVSNVSSSGAALSALSSLIGSDVDISEADVPNDEQFITSLEAALASGDLCEVWATMAQVALDADDSARLASSMRLLSSVMRTAAELVPPTLEPNWTRATNDLDVLAAELDNGEIIKVIDAFEDPQYVDPQRGIVDWVTANCA